MRRFFLCVLCVLGGEKLFAQALALEPSEKIRLVDCSPSSSVPCFRIKANIVDAQGNPASPSLPAATQLAKSFTLQVNNLEVTPFYVTAGAGPGAAVRSRMALVVIDISGSMNQLMENGQSRYAAAKAAALQFLEGFENGADRVAIVPFESHNVIARIRGAVFATTADDARRQVHGLPLPPPKGNTALYSAVGAGLDVLAEQLARTQGSPEVMMIVLTDGKNDIQPGDDYGLLAGPDGLRLVADKVRASGIQVIAVGLGDSRSIDEAAMRQLGTQFHLVSDTAGLQRAFSFARHLLLNRIQATFQSPWADRASLAGRSLTIRATLKLPSGQEVSSKDLTWSPPQIGAPLFEGKCDTAELKAILSPGAGPAPDAGWWTLVRPILVFVSLGAAILILWFWIPRLVWPDQYIGNLPVRASARRWSSGQTMVSRRGGAAAPPGALRTAPPGFTGPHQGRPAAPQRGVADPTIVRPRTDFGARTRLEGRRPQYPEQE
jgi:Ca-activated chloride channel family protein